MLGGDACASINTAIIRTISAWHGTPESITAFIAIAIFCSLFATRLDFLYSIAILAYLNRLSVPSFITWLPTFNLLSLFPVIITLASILVLPLRKRHDASWEGPGKPYLIPCRITHSRILPVKHSFSYSYLTVGIPIGYEGSVNRVLGVDERFCSAFGNKLPFVRIFARSWFSVRASDHFQRGHDSYNLRQKLDLYLQSEGLDPRNFPYSYLVTAPRFAGYSFNPVSFWYLYSPDKTLSAMILEVNNTYDERRAYLVLRDTSSKCTEPAEGRKITGSPVKDFYVSPFNSREGHYSVLAKDPLGPEMGGFTGIDAKITLISSQGHPKLVARLISDSPAVDPAGLVQLAKVAFLAKWFWVGFLTVPRIVKEAVWLLRRHKLHMEDKPEPLIGTLGRHATSIEKTLEICFKNYLEFLAHNSGTPIRVNYYAGGFRSEDKVIFTSQHDVDPDDSDDLELRVLTPALYSRLIQYQEISVGLVTELEEFRTISVNELALLLRLFTPSVPWQKPYYSSFSDIIFLTLAKKLRRRTRKIPVEGSGLTKWSRNLLFLDNSNGAGTHSMEAYIMTHGDKCMRRRYKWAVIKQMMVNRYFMGHVEWLDRGILAIRLAIPWIYLLSIRQI